MKKIINFTKNNIWNIIIFFFLLTVFILTNILVDGHKKVKNFKNENELIYEIKKSIRKNYYNWRIDDNEIINFKKNIKIIYNDSIIKVISLDNYNTKQNIVVNLNYSLNSKEIKDLYKMLKDIKHKENITKIIKKLN
jgi:predicted Zn-dependent protease